MSVAKEVGISVRQSVNKDDIKVLEINHPDSSLRYVPVWSGPFWSGVGHGFCLYAGNNQGGNVFEVERPNDSLIEGSYKDYIVSSIFASDFKFNRFLYGNCE